MTKEEQVMQERGQQYGSFSDNMLKVAFLSRFHMRSILDNYMIDSLFNRSFEPKERVLLISTVDFALTLMSLKAVRSLKAKDGVYDDCIIDFLNYKKLSEEVIKKILKQKQVFSFSDKVFNPILNTDTSFAEVKWLVDADKVSKEFAIYKKLNFDAEKYRLDLQNRS